MKFKLLFLFLLFIGKSYTQKTSASFVDEFNILVESLQELHPALYTNISKIEFDNRVEELRTRLAKTESATTAIYIIQELFYSLGDSHSGNISVYRSDLGVSKALPFNVYIIGNRLYIRNYPAASNFNGAEILSIEQTPASAIIDSLKIFYPIDGSRGVISSYLPLLFNSLYGTFCQQKDTFNVMTDQGQLYAKSIGREDSLFEKFVLKQNQSDENRILNTEINDNYGYIKFIGFVPQYKGYKIEKSYYDLLSEMKSKGINNLVVDLRNNSGGDPYMAGRMASSLAKQSFSIFEKIYITPIRRPTHLKYMSEKMSYRFRRVRCKKSGELNEVVRFEKGLKSTQPKKDNFNGQIYILVDGATQSSSTMFCSYLMNQPNVTFVGNETMGAINYFWAGQHCKITLPTLNTTFSFGLELIELKQGTGNSKLPIGLIPDQIIQPTIQDLITEKDLEIKFVVADILKRSKQ